MSFFDLTDNFISNKDTNGGLAIHFVHVPTNKKTFFKAFITSWEDSFEQDWKPYSTVGRMDDIRIYAKTSRTLNFNIDIPSADELEATRNFKAVQDLIQMSYPAFEEIPITSNSNTSPTTTPSSPQAAEQNNAIATTTSPQAATNSGPPKTIVSLMGSPPFFNVSFSNWTLNATETNNVGGLYGVIKTIKFSPEFSETGFYGSNSVGYGGEKSVLVPKEMKLSISMNVIHTEKLGFRTNPKQSETVERNPNFPYSANDIQEQLQTKVSQPNQFRLSNNSISVQKGFEQFARDLDGFNKLNTGF